jgi:hypothetical protein
VREFEPVQRVAFPALAQRFSVGRRKAVVAVWAFLPATTLLQQKTHRLDNQQGEDIDASTSRSKDTVQLD